jgi:hypothetical protein
MKEMKWIGGVSWEIGEGEPLCGEDGRREMRSQKPAAACDENFILEALEI